MRAYLIQYGADITSTTTTAMPVDAMGLGDTLTPNGDEGWGAPPETNFVNSLPVGA